MKKKNNEVQIENHLNNKEVNNLNNNEKII